MEVTGEISVGLEILFTAVLEDALRV